MLDLNLLANILTEQDKFSISFNFLPQYVRRIKVCIVIYSVYLELGKYLNI